MWDVYAPISVCICAWLVYNILLCHPIFKIVCAHVCMYMHAHPSVCMCTCAHVCAHTCIYVRVCVCMCVLVRAHARVCVCTPSVAHMWRSEDDLQELALYFHLVDLEA